MILIDNVFIALGVLYATLNIMYVLTVVFLGMADKLKTDEVFIIRQNNLLTYLLFTPGKVFLTAWTVVIVLLGGVSCVVTLHIYLLLFKVKK